jgi:hypothetical protein
LWLGASRTGSITTAGWSWVDGTDATALNCGAVGCGPWPAGEPTGVGDTGVEDKLDILAGKGLNDVPTSTANAYVCEVEVCRAGMFANGGSGPAGCSDCPAGKVGVSAGRSGQPVACAGICRAGYACPEGSSTFVAVLCEAGSYSVAGAGSCTACAAGLYGSTPGLATASCTAPCPAGSFSSGGAATAACTGLCSPGYYCPTQSINSTVVPCEAGKYSLPGAESCTSCPQTAPYSAPRSTSLSACISVCPNTSWILWFDSNGTEGAHSCLLQVVAAVTWGTANSSCWAIGGGSHLLTSRQVRNRN